MLFSKVYSIQKDRNDDWFDPILTLDTLLFIDPLLIFEKYHPGFIHASGKIIEFFNKAFEIAARSTGNSQDLRHKQLLKMLVFPEVRELCLGYSSGDTDGAGSGGKYSRDTVAAIYESIEMGMKSIENFEFLGIFNEGIGRDRISDITANILKKEFVEYTQQICNKHKVPMLDFELKNYNFNYQTNRWNSQRVKLPENPFFPDRAVILTPGVFIDEKPNINADSFKDFIWDNKNKEVRDEFNIQIKNSIDKSKIIEIAKKHRGWMSDFKKSLRNVSGYDYIEDPGGVYTTTIGGLQYAESNPLTMDASSKDSFKEIVEKLVGQYQNFIENNSGYQLLWNDDSNKPKTEKAAQLVFTGILKSHCEANNIDISGEANLGRGPVDFKFSLGYQDRVAIEIKKASHSRFWNGLTAQLPKYMEVEDISFGYFIVICFHEDDFKKVKGIEEIVIETKRKYNKEFKYRIIDATPNKLSASKL
ncbi:MAG: hypothetical protein J7604_25820 [Sporocytophaga sp.]|uniref:hypothetical protein n=1 Tax=Sporocytophaga sp. TaxID=2231183 RepID=UPI001B1C1E88|nr:hypothetical protein [Sporocytophaga sp.]MBO9703649.1 hypothetical protein [Sporocytophaga sp.]